MLHVAAAAVVVAVVAALSITFAGCRTQSKPSQATILASFVCDFALIVNLN